MANTKLEIPSKWQKVNKEEFEEEKLKDPALLIGRMLGED